jgi:hypothetical protein
MICNICLSVGRAAYFILTSHATTSNHVARRLLYSYYNWRVDTVSDLQLILGFNLGLVVVGSLIKAWLLHHGPNTDGSIWSDVYEVVVLSFGENFPSPFEGSPSSQLFSVIVATFGLATFAVVVALVEQAVLELIDANVKRGSDVYEENHVR